MPAQIIPVSPSPRLPDIAGAISRGIALGQRAKQAARRDSLLRQQLVLEEEREDRLSKESEARIATFASQILQQKEETARTRALTRQTEVKTKRERAGKSTLADVLLGRVEASDFVSGRFVGDVAGLEATRAQTKVSEKSAENLESLIVDRRVTREHNLMAKEREQVFDYAEIWVDDLTPDMRRAIKNNPEGVGIRGEEGKALMAALPEVVDKKLDLSTRSKQVAWVADQLIESGDHEAAAKILLHSFGVGEDIALSDVRNASENVKKMVESIQKALGGEIKEEPSGARRVKHIPGRYSIAFRNAGKSLGLSREDRLRISSNKRIANALVRGLKDKRKGQSDEERLVELLRILTKKGP